MLNREKRAAILLLIGLAACSKPAAPPEDTNTTTTAAAVPQVALPMPAAEAPPVQHTDDPMLFVPLRSSAVKDAIHRALRSGETQRWKDGKLSGYAVPSQTTGANGCRAVRYTVDQRPGAPFESITACDAGR